MLRSGLADRRRVRVERRYVPVDTVHLSLKWISLTTGGWIEKWPRLERTWTTSVSTLVRVAADRDVRRLELCSRLLQLVELHSELVYLLADGDQLVAICRVVGGEIEKLSQLGVERLLERALRTDSLPVSSRDPLLKSLQISYLSL